MSIGNIHALQEAMDYTRRGWRNKESYFEVKAKLVKYIEGGQYLFGNQEEYSVIFQSNRNYITVDIPSFQGFGYYFSFSSEYQNFKFDKFTGILNVHGDKAKSGKPYDIAIELESG